MTYPAARVKGEGHSTDGNFVVHQHKAVKERVLARYKRTCTFECCVDMRTKRQDRFISSEPSFETPVSECTVPFTMHPKTEVLMHQHV
jgi:hypothetical protein